MYKRQLQLLLGHLPVGHADPRLPGGGMHAIDRLVDGAHAVGHVVHLLSLIHI